MATKEERDARLDELAKATKKWAEEETKRLTNQVALGKRILKGRTGSERLTSASVQSVSNLVVDEINSFLTG
jgi:hypothetical protein